MADVLVKHLTIGICREIKCSDDLSYCIQEFWLQQCYIVDLYRINHIYRYLFHRCMNREKLKKILMHIADRGAILPDLYELDPVFTRSIYIASHFLLEEYYNITNPMDPDNPTYQIIHMGYLGYCENDGLSLRELCNAVFKL
jgi:hypothetical protein